MNFANTTKVVKLLMGGPRAYAYLCYESASFIPLRRRDSWHKDRRHQPTGSIPPRGPIWPRLPRQLRLRQSCPDIAGRSPSLLNVSEHSRCLRYVQSLFANLRSEEGDECSLFSSAVAARTTSSTGSSASLRPYKRADISTTFVVPVTRAVAPAVARKPPLILLPNSPSSIPAPSRAS